MKSSKVVKSRRFSFPRSLYRYYLWLLCTLPAVLFFSYYPLISLGGNATMNFDFSLPLLWLVLFDVVAFVALLMLGRAGAGDGGNDVGNVSGKASTKSALTRANARGESGRAASSGKERLAWRHNFPGISDRKFFLFALFPLYATLSIFWSANPTRAVLTAGILWLVFAAVFAILFITPLLLNSLGLTQISLRRIILRVLFVASALICAVCWAQCLLDVLGFSSSYTFLCRGCTSATFGFPHPSGFAIEPQFMGNLLLAPVLTAFYLWIFRRDQLSSGRRRTGFILLTAFLTATLFLTFSRGAIYAFAVALAILFVIALAQHHLRPLHIVLPVVAFITVLVVQGIFCVLGPTSEGFASGVTKSIHHLSLGLIDLRPGRGEKSANGSEAGETESSATTPIFDGYVAESTNTRLDLNQAAFDTWLSAPGHPESDLHISLQCFGNSPCHASGPVTPTSVFFGVGLGGAGQALYANAFITGVTSPKEIVQNEPFSLLLELGLVGIALVIMALVLAFGIGSHFWHHPALPLLATLIVAYVITLNFFSGFANALQIYLVPPLLYLIFNHPQENPHQYRKISSKSCQKVLAKSRKM